MKLNIAFPETGKVKVVECDDEKRLIAFFDKRIGNEVEADAIGDEWKGYVVRITGGNDKQGFPMMQGVLCSHRVRLLMRPGMPCYRARRTGALRRKSVRGCVVASDISSLNLIVVRKGEKEIEGLTDEALPRRLGPKRASKIRKLFGLSPADDVRKFVIRRKISDKCSKAPKIQRLVTAERLARKVAYKKQLAARSEKRVKAAEEFAKLIADHAEKKRQAAAVEAC